jgi:branched-subunit amino acid ABC-type transport system permease component
MSSPSMKLYRLRGIFIAYFVLKSLAGAVVAWSVFRTLAEERLRGMRGWTPKSLAGVSLMGTALVLALALLVFARLLRRKNWARVLLLVLGWLAVINALFTLLTSAQLSEMGAWVARLVPGLDLDWEKLMQFDRIQKVFELLFWGYLISVLQFDPAVRNEFFPAEAVEKKKEG